MSKAAQILNLVTSINEEGNYGEDKLVKVGKVSVLYYKDAGLFQGLATSHDITKIHDFGFVIKGEKDVSGVTASFNGNNNTLEIYLEPDSEAYTRAEDDGYTGGNSYKNIKSSKDLIKAFSKDKLVSKWDPVLADSKISKVVATLCNLK